LIFWRISFEKHGGIISCAKSSIHLSSYEFGGLQIVDGLLLFLDRAFDQLSPMKRMLFRKYAKDKR